MAWVVNEWYIVGESSETKAKAKENGIIYQCIVKGCSHKVKTLERLCRHLKKHYFKCPEDNGKFRCFCKLIKHIKKEHLTPQILPHQGQSDNPNEEEMNQEDLKNSKQNGIKSDIKERNASNTTNPMSFNDEIPRKRQSSVDHNQEAPKKLFHSAILPFKHSEVAYKDSWKTSSNDFSSNPSYGALNLSHLNGSIMKETFEKTHHEEIKKESSTERILIKPKIPKKPPKHTKKDQKEPSAASTKTNNTAKCASNPFTARVAKKSVNKIEDKSVVPTNTIPLKHQFSDDHSRGVFK